MVDAPLRIGLIAPPWVPVPPPRYGGVEVAIDQLARGLASEGHEVVLFATKDSTCPVEVRSVIDVAPGVHVGGAAVEASHVLAAYESFDGFDVVHDHTTIGPWFAAALTSGPVVATNHNRFVEPFVSIYRTLCRPLPLVALSAHHARTSPIPVAAVIGHGLDVDSMPFGETSEDYALFLGRMSPDKGVAEAVAIARSADVPLVIAAKMSSDDEHEYFREVVEPQLGERCRYVGEVDQDLKLRLLSRARCLLNPVTWEEPFGIVMIESLACGTPVIVRRRGAAGEIVTDGRTGFVRESDAELGEALLAVQALSRSACRQEVAQRFSAKSVAARHLELYRGAIAASDGSPVRLLRDLSNN